MVQGVHAAAQGKLVRSDDTSIDSQDTAGNPPTDRVTEEVDLLTGVVLSPEADTTEKERPLVRMGSVRVAAGQLAVVPEHGPLQLEPLRQERQTLDLLLRLGPSRGVSGQRRNILNKPDIGAGGKLFVAVDLLLLKGPLR